MFSFFFFKFPLETKARLYTSITETKLVKENTTKAIKKNVSTTQSRRNSNNKEEDPSTLRCKNKQKKNVKRKLTKRYFKAGCFMILSLLLLLIAYDWLNYLTTRRKGPQDRLQIILIQVWLIS